MKRFYLFLFIFYICLSVTCTGDVNKILKMINYSINIPDGWIVNKENENKVVFIMPEAKDDEISICIFTTPTHNSLSLDEAWNKMKPLMIKNKNVSIDDQDYFSGIIWKKLEIQEVICNIEINKIVLFTQKNAINYLIQFDCPKDKLAKVLPLFNLTMQSIKIKNATEN